MNNDLISRSALAAEIWKSLDDNPHKDAKANSAHRSEHMHFLRLVSAAPTVYDVNKVITDLEATKQYLLNSTNDCIALSDKEVNALTESDFNKAIDIVKRGGI